MKNLSLNMKVAIVVTIFALASIVISVMGITRLNGINDSLNSIVEGDAKRLEIALRIRSRFLNQVVAEKNFIMEQEKEQMNEYGRLISEGHDRIDANFSEYEKLATNQAAKDIVANIRAQYKEWTSKNDQVRKLSIEGKNSEAALISMKDQREIRKKVEELVETLVKRNQDFMAEASQRTDEEYVKGRNSMILISLVSIIGGALLAFFIMRAVSRSIDQVIANLRDSSNQVSSAAQQIASSSEQLSQAATEQASSLEETASSIEEMSSMVQKNSDNAKSSSEVSGVSQQSAEKGKQVVKTMIEAIDGINASNTEIMQQIDESNHQISDIVKVISEIGNKTKVINDIVFQTKLLSFNASVEAARAGEHGKGFAVVAEEVGNLAQMSGNAAKEISAMLDGSILKVEGIVTDTKSKVERLISEGKDKVQAGTRVAQECGAVLDEIVEKVSRVTGMVGEISTACQEQAQGVSEITKAMSQMDQTTQQNAATSEEAASAAEELSAQAEALGGVVQVLINTVKGANGAPAGATARASAPRATNARAASPVRASAPAPAPKARSSEPSGAVVHMKNAVSRKAKATRVEMKMAAGAEGVPSESDPRFEDV